ncbi:sialidase family protein [Pseudodesulfovibrio sp.]|uniref:sialidase family protein n=1 Tax=unclassified Pseudodesulfovibrio TaxID=2661612 RepID=UPI003AFF74E1
MPSLSDLAARHVVIDRREGEYLCFPDVITAPDGRLVAAYNEADQHVTPSRRTVVVKHSLDQGRTWSDVIRPDSPRSHCPRLFRQGNDLLIADASRIFHRSTDNGATWTPMPITGIEHDMLDRPLDLGDGVLLTTGHMHRGRASQPAIRQAPAEQMAYRSEDGGKSWIPLTAIARERNLVLCEASMLRLEDGRIAALMRENSFIFEPMYLCFSDDEGETWSDPVETPLIGHRPTLGQTSSGNLLVTYRNVAPNSGTCAWLGSLDELQRGFAVQGLSWQDNPISSAEGLHVVNGETDEAVVRYALRPMTDPRFARATLEAEVRVDAAGKNGCGIYLGHWWRIGTDNITADGEDGPSVPLAPGRFHTLRLDYADGGVTLSVDNEPRARISVEPDCAETRPIMFGAPRPFEDNQVDCTWRRVALFIDEPRLGRSYSWDWHHSQGRPDQRASASILELKNDRQAAAPDFGYSGWTELADGEFFCAYHHGGGDEPDYEPLFTSRIMGTRFSLSDFEK